MTESQYISELSALGAQMDAADAAQLESLLDAVIVLRLRWQAESQRAVEVPLCLG